MLTFFIVLGVSLILIFLVMKYGIEGILGALVELVDMLVDLIGLEISTEALEILVLVGL